MAFLHILSCFLLLVLFFHSTLSEFSRDRELGYWHDLLMPYYEPNDNNATVSCSITVYEGSITPLNMTLMSNNKGAVAYIPKQGPGDLVLGPHKVAVEIVAKPNRKYACQLELANGRKDNLTIDIPALDGTPVVWFKSSKYPENEEVPLTSFYWLLYDVRGEEPLSVDITFSICDPKGADCEEQPTPAHNYERWPSNETLFKENQRRSYMTGHATQSGYYILKASNAKGLTTAYYHLKVADGKAKQLDVEAEMGYSSENRNVPLGDSVELSCPIPSPEPKKDLIMWFKDGKRIYRDSHLKGSEKGEKLMIPKMTAADYGRYKCYLDYLDQHFQVHSDSAYISLSNPEVSAAEPLTSSCSLLLLFLLLVSWFREETTHL